LLFVTECSRLFCKCQQFSKTRM